jgi:hypothetical protein
MMNATRRQLLRALDELSEIGPEYRLEQLVANLAFLAKPGATDATWNVEDEDLLVAAHKHLQDMKERPASVA